MYVCMYVCIYLCMYLSIYLSIYVSMYLCIYVSMYLCIYVCMYLCMYTCMYACMYVCMHVCMYVRACMYVCLSIYVGYVTCFGKWLMAFIDLCDYYHYQISLHHGHSWVIIISVFIIINHYIVTDLWFQHWLIFRPLCDDDPKWRIVSGWVETNQIM